MKKIYTTFSFLIFIGSAFAQSTGFTAPTAALAPNGFTNPNNAFVSDDVWTSVAHGSGCRCPFLYLSYNGGTNYTSSQILGPFGTTDQTSIAGGSSFTWGRTWAVADFTNANFRLKIANPSTLIEQGYGNFNFVIPGTATITGIAVQLEWHGDANFTMEFLDQAMVNVYYTNTTATGQTYSSSTSVSLFPNPSHDIISLNFNSEKALNYTLFDLQGQKVMENSLTQITSGTTDLDLSSLPRGIYMIRIVTENGISNKKIVLE